VRNFAEGTVVAVERSKGEIEALIHRAGADEFASGTRPGQSMIQFKLRGRVIRFMLPLPKQDEKRFTVCGRYNSIQRSPEAAFKAWEQACRERWRALFLSIKAKLYSIECGIESFDSAFMAQIVMPNQRTMEELCLPMIEQAYKTGVMPDMNVLALGY
jgi:hypothetical protein